MQSNTVHTVHHCFHSGRQNGMNEYWDLNEAEANFAHFSSSSHRLIMSDRIRILLDLPTQQKASRQAQVCAPPRSDSRERKSSDRCHGCSNTSRHRQWSQYQRAILRVNEKWREDDAVGDEKCDSWSTDGPHLFQLISSYIQTKITRVGLSGTAGSALHAVGYMMAQRLQRQK